MRLPPAIIGSTEEVLREVLRFTGPADGTLSRYFREHPRLGGRERGVIAEAIYGLLRNKSVYTNFAESGTGPIMRRMTLLGLADAAGVDALGGLSEEERVWLERVMQIDRSTLPAALRANLPEWLFDKLVARDGEAATLELAQAMNKPAPLDLRVNAIKADRDAVVAELAQAPILCESMPYAPLGIRVIKKPALQNLPLFKNGSIEVQDEGSQLLSQIVGAKRGEMVVDFCAGAGGKTLSLGAAMRNTGRLYAFDISDKRLAKLKPRLARSGLSNVHPVLIAHENDAKVKRLAGKIDRVLVDAPCSGLGTLRRNPDVKWRQTPQALSELNEKQISILSAAARLVKPGGRLVYATCSILDEENDAIVAQFLAARDDFTLLPMNQVLLEQKVALEMDDYLKLLPHKHQTDGFFAAVFERKK
ncbi:MAG: RsmB/NOP family class I SAM-dependent RNA methyltransferase [Oxalicibacterium faecigallinarum]|uniref:RsmB/NOP family class I SAM-dependent RNA methyltransferase n=1 Tax=Oxalicibacterium faecigallinarum TaxID=573741 RepID=UPI0028087983|nr:RsmB/NOP family class I SAM-dependent RNA methyltransferase [Oxalicibacterium faecigallinarum]MDQ7968782.1 RsmB/NOP family class I SAM-dependent RNA methyltransferase [Oxalicibacterium faecigallinarum]